MITDSISNAPRSAARQTTEAADKAVHDTVFATVVSILFVIPATLAALSLIA